MADREPARSRLHAAVDGAVVVAAALAVHGRSLAFDFTGLDDRDLVVDDQPFLSAPSSLWRVFGRAYMHVVDAGHAYWRPLVTWTLVLDAQWSGARPFGYHLTNLVLHAVACVLVWRLLGSFRLGPATSLAGALLFAVHPAFAAAVAWIPGRNDTLLAVFALAAWLALLRGWTAVHLAFFGLALLTKETAFALPLVWLVHCGLLTVGPRGRALGLHAVAWGLMSCVRVLLHPADVTLTIANAPRVVVALGEIVLPVHLSVLADAQDLPAWPGVVAVVGLALAQRFVPGVRRRLVVVGVSTFVLFLLPSVLVAGTLVLDCRLYLPAVGIVLVLGEIVRSLSLERRVFAAFAGVSLVALAVVTAAFEGSFRDRRAFARDAVAGSPHSAMAHFCLGRSAQLDGDDDLALAEYQAALALGPAEVVHNDIAVLHMKHARWPEAEQELHEELSGNPRYARGYYNLGIVLRHEGRLEEACASERDAVRLGADDEATSRERDRDCGPPTTE
jgi:protein O-mannosyl-transferase